MAISESDDEQRRGEMQSGGASAGVTPRTATRPWRMILGGALFVSGLIALAIIDPGGAGLFAHLKAAVSCRSWHNWVDPFAGGTRRCPSCGSALFHTKSLLPYVMVLIYAASATITGTICVLQLMGFAAMPAAEWSFVTHALRFSWTFMLLSTIVVIWGAETRVQVPWK